MSLDFRKKFIITSLISFVSVQFASYSFSDEIVELERPYKSRNRSFNNQKASTYRQSLTNDLEQESQDFQKTDKYDSPMNLNARKKLKELFLREPTIAEVQRAAERYMAIPSNEEFRRFRAQARLRNLLPSISGDGDFTKQRYGSYTKTIPNPGATFSPTTGSLTYNNQDDSRTGYRTNGFGFDSEWNLNKLIYDDEITDILSEQRRFIPIKSDIIDQVHRAYYERRNRISVFILNPPKKETEKLLVEIEIEELTAKLDSLTGGWFSSQLFRRNQEELSTTNFESNQTNNTDDSDNKNNLYQEIKLDSRLEIDLDLDLEEGLEIEAESNSK